MKHFIVLYLININLGLTVKNKLVEESDVWAPFPDGFDLTKPDEILDRVREAAEGTTAGTLPFSNIYMFGDSSCDTGNFYKQNGGEEPRGDVYWKGREANGPMWPDYLQSIFDVQIKSYAYGGSTVLNSNYFHGETIPDFPRQVDIYIKEPKFDAANPLAIIEFVGNDLLNPVMQSSKVAKDIEEQLQRLVDLDEIKHYIVLETVEASFINRDWNKALNDMVKRFQTKNPNIKITTLGSVELYNAMIKVAPPTATPGYWFGPPKSCFNQKLYTVCPDPENYFLFDLYHPGTVPNFNVAHFLGQKIQELDWL